ncbi:MAG TPA: M15 family metallopeptidase [Exilispira sp.]|nr:M15 family metallopeptidase [Exilispira sp.]
MKKYIEKEIPEGKKLNWDLIRSIPIYENNEPLVPLNLYPERILCHPEYFIQQIANAMPVLYAREGLYKKLIEASKNLPKGFKFVVYDAYRPVEVQKSLFDSYKNKLAKQNPTMNEDQLIALTLNFVSLPSEDPKKPSAHSTGGSIDLTIVDDEGKLLDMGSYFDDMGDIVITTYFEEKLKKGEKLGEKELKIIENRRLLYNIMIEQGFTNFVNEWWHYDYGNQLWAYNGNHPNAIYTMTKPFFFWKE